jgi:beta-lactamase superfamily II metal-dependent hydrolase
MRFTKRLFETATAAIVVGCAAQPRPTTPGSPEPQSSELGTRQEAARGVVGVPMSLTAEAEDAAPPWGLHIVVLDVGQADAIVAVSDDGEAMVIDAGHGKTAADRILGFLGDAEQNGFGVIDEVKTVVVTHYDQDHVGGVAGLIDGVSVLRVFDQGPSQRRRGAATYTTYLAAVGDANDNLTDDESSETHPYIRRKARPGNNWRVGEARARVVAVRGDTKGTAHDLELDPAQASINENPGSVAVLVTLGEFELYTAGDQTSDDWKSEPDTEIGVVASGVLGADPDIDVLKVNHHGSDTSTGDAFVNALDPEVAIISSQFRSDHRLPRLTTIKQLVENDAVVYVTGKGKGPDSKFAQSSHAEDDGYEVPEGAVFDDAGDVHVIVDKDGRGYSIRVGDKSTRFSSVDSDNPHP